MVEPEVPPRPRALLPGLLIEGPRAWTVRRTSYAWSPAVLDLLRHVESDGFAGAPPALGFDDQGREILTYMRKRSTSGGWTSTLLHWWRSDRKVWSV